MTRRVILRPQVPGDLHTIVTYPDSFSAAVADRFVESVFAALDDLAAMPGKGSPKRLRIPTLAGLRSWAVPRFPNHLIYYMTTDEAIIVCAVLHGARNLPVVLRRRGS